jgi:hypothetical protein
MQKVVVGGLKVKGKAHALSSTQQRKMGKELKLEKAHWSGHDFIFACANFEGNEQRELMDATQDQCCQKEPHL